MKEEELEDLEDEDEHTEEEGDECMVIKGHGYNA